MAIHWPVNRKDWFFFGIFWLGGLWTLYYEYFFVLRSYHSDWNNMVMLHFIVGAFFAMSIYTNMLMMISTDITTKRITTLPSENPLALEWKFCEKCQQHSPPRSHHCKICDVCILKRDHHCWFAGYCVAFHNQRHFVALTFYATIAGIYANIYNLSFFLEVKGGFTWSTLPALLAPHFGLTLGYYSLYEFFITAITSTGFFFTIFFAWLFFSQTKQILKGQTQHEVKKGILHYSCGILHEIKEVFGSAGFAVFICPFIPTTFAHDGTHFQVRADKKE